jgi:diguanylate cyclase (GGDEF)-like protein
MDAMKNTLRENYLENNLHCATKIATSTNDLFKTMDQNIRTLAKIIGRKEFTQKDLDEWRTANNSYFNSIFTTDSEGVVQLMSPQKIPNSAMKPGTKIVTDLMKQALENKKPFISEPYMAQSGNLMLLISSPIFDEKGNYRGVVDGTIYLESENSLKTLINKHLFLDGTSVFVVDKTGKIIYHPDSNRINESVAENPLIANLMEGNNGSAQIINSKGVEYFSGYAYVESTGWGIITQTPVTVMDQPLRKLTNDMIFKALPFLLIIMLIASVLTSNLLKPLNILARYSEEAIKRKKSPESVSRLPIKSRIYEVSQFYQQIQRHFELLNHQLQRDGLTGLENRRTFDIHMVQLLSQKQPFSFIMIDIDHFKKVNDTYGHLVGDDVLRFLSALMQDCLRGDDLCYRYGGEEFAIILKDKKTSDAYALAERLRLKVAETTSPTGKPITISLGISAYQVGDEQPEEIIHRADRALYRSKTEGRNRTTVS